MSSFKILENIDLNKFTTFRIGGPAKYFCVVKDQFDALSAFEFAKEKSLATFVLGGGSNLLVSDKGFDGLVIKVENRGIEILHQNKNEVLLKVSSGEKWDEVVKFAVSNNWWGIENLSHIPGSCGAIAVQNVGAYGQEAKDVIESVTVFDRENGQITEMQNSQCNFEYRSSIFNTTNKNQFIIFNLTLKLQKNGKANLKYKDLKKIFLNTEPLLLQIREAIIKIRNTKFPFPSAFEAKDGNAGSFFKNIFLKADELPEINKIIKKNFGPQILQNFELHTHKHGDNYKISTAFLIDICGLKNLQVGGAAINLNQPLVIVNKTGFATAKDVLSLAQIVLKRVAEHTGLILKIEPELLGFSSTELNFLNML